MARKTVRRDCPLCLSRYCTNCFARDITSRRWMEKNLPGGECRRCGAHRNAVRQKPVRHTSEEVAQGHRDIYAAELFTKRPRLVPRDADHITSLARLVMSIEDDVFGHYSESSRLAAGMYRSAWDEPDRLTDREIETVNSVGDRLLRIESVIRRWVADHPEEA